MAPGRCDDHGARPRALDLRLADLDRSLDQADVEAAGRCGIGTIGVTTGGWSAEELESAGAIAVYQSVGDLLRRLGTSPIARLLSA
jgi:hypothetical protein